MNEKLLIVDDEKGVVDMLKSYFEMQSFVVYTAYDGETALKQAACHPDLVLLDINMPGMDGLTVCEKIRSHISCPILFLTARIETADKIKGFQVGADDYIIKPFDIDELGARVAAHLRRENRKQGQSELRFFSEMVIDYSKREVSINGTPINLSKKEFDIVELLSLNAGQVFDRERIYEAVWGLDGEGNSDTIMEHIRKIRSKFTALSHHSYIETVWGGGLQMEWIKNMSLKKSLFTLTLINLLLALSLSAVVFVGCTKLSAVFAPSGVQIIVGADSTIKTEFPEPVAGATAVKNALAIFQFVLPMLFFIVALILTASLFYRWKLKVPLAILMDGANRMMENDLDFTIPSVSGDELGQLCIAFETMRQSLLNSNRELWRQTEERKRLNAAFSHDLRNPITVLKGSAKMAKQCADIGNTPQLIDNLERMEAYTGRIERYVETMSKVQRLEQVQPEKVTFDTAALSADLEKALGFSAADHGKQLYFHGLSAGGTVTLDKGMLFQVAENLTTNALRFAKENVSVELSIEGENLKLEISDDGDGFPAELLKNGIQPFRKGTEEAEHLGMGLYICDLLCRKHGGTLKIANTDIGAVASAILKIS